MFTDQPVLIKVHQIFMSANGSALQTPAVTETAGWLWRRVPAFQAWNLPTGMKVIQTQINDMSDV